MQWCRLKSDGQRGIIKQSNDTNNKKKGFPLSSLTLVLGMPLGKSNTRDDNVSLPDELNSYIYQRKNKNSNTLPSFVNCIIASTTNFAMQWISQLPGLNFNLLYLRVEKFFLINFLNYSCHLLQFFFKYFI